MPLFNFLIRFISVGVFLGGCYFPINHFFIAPKIAENASLERQLNEMDGKIEQMFAGFPNLESLENQLKETEKAIKPTEEKVAELESGLLDQERFDSLVNEAAISRGTRERIGGYFRQPIKLDYETHYADLVKYLDVLERSSPFLRFQTIRMSQEKEGAEELLRTVVELEATYSPKRRPLRTAVTPVKGPSAPPNLSVTKDPFTYLQKQEAPETPIPGLLYLTEIIFNGQNRYAVINGRAVKEGDVLPGGSLVGDVGAHEVSIQKDTVEFTLKIH